MCPRAARAPSANACAPVGGRSLEMYRSETSRTLLRSPTGSVCSPTMSTSLPGGSEVPTVTAAASVPSSLTSTNAL